VEKMFPGLGKMNPAQMQKMLKQFGIKSEELKTKKVLIELEDGKTIVVENPNVSLMRVQGQKIYSVMGGTEKESSGKEMGFKEEDIKMVMRQAEATEEEAIKALKESSGDIAEAIVRAKK
jgi:nascent polypeptide-associated complex subunit alpha